MSAKFVRTHMAMGSFEIAFRPLPQLLEQFVPFRHIAFDLGASRKFIGVITEIDRSDEHQIVLRGAGPEWWLGEDDRNGPIREPRTWASQTSNSIVSNLLLRQDGTHALGAGTLNAGNVVSSFAVNYETCRRAVQRLVVMTRTEYRINTDFTFDWAGNANLFQTRNLVLSEAAETAATVVYSPTTYRAITKAIALGNGTGDRIDVQTATASPDPAWKDWNNIAYERDMLVDAPSAADTSQASALATSIATSRSSGDKEAQVSLARLSILNQFDIGDTVYVHRDRVLEDVTNAITYEGAVYPAISMRVASYDVSIGPEWSIILRSPDGTETDLTDLALRETATKVDVRLVSTPEAFFAPLENSTATGTDNRRTQQTLGTGAVDSTALGTAIGLGNFVPGLRPIQEVSSLPALPDANYPLGAVVFLSTDYKLYRSTGSAWTVVTDGADILANSITGAAIAAGTLTADKLVVGNWDNLFENPSFELPDDANIFTNCAKMNDVTNSRTGSYCAKGTSSSAISVQQPTKLTSARAGDEFYCECYYKNSSGGTGSTSLILDWQDASGGILSSTTLATGTAGTAYTLLAGNAAAPAGCAYVAVRIQRAAGSGTWYLDDIFFKQMVESAWISGLIADKILTGSLAATVSITSGLIRTAASGARAEITSAGLNLYAVAAAADIGTNESLKFWRAGAGDSLPIAAVVPYWDTAGTVPQNVSMSIRPTSDTGHTHANSLSIVNAADTATRSLLSLLRTSGDAAGVIFEVFDAVSALYPFKAGNSVFNDSGVGYYRTMIEGPVRIRREGVIYENAGVVGSGTVNAGTVHTTSVTYASAFDSSLPNPDLLLSVEDGSGSQWRVIATARSLTGFDFSFRNDDTVSRSINGVYLPFVS